jgi:hypothetical protein
VRGHGVSHLAQEGQRLFGRLHRRGLRQEAALADVLRMPAGGDQDVQGIGHGNGQDDGGRTLACRAAVSAPAGRRRR